MAKSTKSTKTSKTSKPAKAAKELTEIGSPEHTARFKVGDLVQVHLEMKGQVFLDGMHGAHGTVISLVHHDDEYKYNLPCIDVGGSLYMYNPDHLIVVQHVDGSEGEVEMLRAAEEFTAKARAERDAKAEAEKK